LLLAIQLDPLSQIRPPFTAEPGEPRFEFIYRAV